MDSIIIFDKQSQIVDSAKKSESELYYEGLTKKIPKYIVEFFKEIDNQETINEESTITAIAISSIIDFITLTTNQLPFSKVVESNVENKNVTYKADKNIKVNFGDTQIVVAKDETIYVEFMENHEILDRDTVDKIYTFEAPSIDLFTSGTFSSYNFLENKYNKYNTTIKAPVVKTKRPDQLIKLIKKAKHYYGTNTFQLLRFAYRQAQKYISNKSDLQFDTFTSAKSPFIVKEIEKAIKMVIYDDNPFKFLLNLHSRKLLENYNKIELLCHIGEKNEIDAILNEITIKRVSVVKKPVITFSQATTKLLIEAIQQNDHKKIKDIIGTVKPTDHFVTIKDNRVCSHLIYQGLLLISDHQTDEADRENEEIRKIISKYAYFSKKGQEPTKNSYDYFCKICGDKLGTLDESVLQEEGIDILDPLYRTIYKEVSYIVNNYISIAKFSQSVSIIVRNVSDIIKDPIQQIEINLLKVKTMSRQDSSKILSINIYIYAFAVLVHLIYTNEFIGFKNFSHKVPEPIKGGGDLSKKIDKKHIKTLQQLINIALSVVNEIKADDIQNIRDFSPETVKSIFLKAYKWIIGVNFTFVEFSKTNYFLQNTVIDYFIYAYNKTHPPLPVFRNYLYPIWLKKGSKLMDNIQNILGRDYATIEAQIPKNIGIFSTLVFPKIPKEKDEYIWGSVEFLYEYVKNEIYNLPSFPISKKEKELLEKFAYLKDLEKQRDLQFKLTQVKPIFRLPPKKKATKKLGNIIDFGSSLANQLEFTYGKITCTLKQINEWLMTNNPNIKKLQKLTAIKLKPYKSKGNYVAFYNYYTNACPMGDFHNFVTRNNVSECTKCGIRPEYITNEDEKFYNKYKNKFFQNKVKDVPIFPPPTFKTKAFEKWKKDKVTNMDEFLGLFQTTDVHVLNMGLTEGIEKSQLYKNVFDLKEYPDDMIVKRNNLLFDYYLGIIRGYYVVRNSELLFEVPEKYKGFLKKYSNKDLIKLPNINDDIIEKYRYYRDTIDPRELSLFLLNLIVDTLLVIHKLFKKVKHEEMGLAFVKLLFDNIEKSDANLTAFHVRRSVSKQAEINEDEVEETEEITDNDAEPEEPTEDTDPFSRNDIDFGDYEEDED